MSLAHSSSGRGGVWLVPLLAGVLGWIGWSGIVRGDELSGSSSYAGRQVVWLVVGGLGMASALLVPYRQWRSWAYPGMLGCLALLLLVLLTPPRNGARSWFALGPVTFQPSEFAKLAYILALSRYLTFARHHRTLLGLLAPLSLTFRPMVLILREPDLGTAAIFPPVLFSMLYAAGARVRHLAIVGLVGLMAAPLLWRELNQEQRSRITTMFRQQDGGAARRGDDYHLHQSKQVLALGRIWGSELAGMAVADADAYHLPAARTDFIFCLVGERWGVWGAGGLLLAYALLINVALQLGARTDEPFGRLICVGVASWIGAQALINTAMTVGLAPITGITLPLVSYGGSSLLSVCLGLGLVMNVGLRPGYEISPRPFLD